jgi:hypothetical protein
MYVIFRLGGVCSHVGTMLYKLIAVNNLPCTSQENRWIDTSNRNDLVCYIFQFKKVYCIIFVSSLTETLQKTISGRNDTIY